MKINNNLIDGITEKIWFYGDFDKEFYDLILNADDEDDETFNVILDAIESFALGYDSNYKFEYITCGYSNKDYSIYYEVDCYLVIAYNHIIAKEVILS